jgi:hypothetical protein
MKAYRVKLSIDRCWRLLKVSRRGYYEWLKATQRPTADEFGLKAAELFDKYKRSYGAK